MSLDIALVRLQPLAVLRQWSSLVILGEYGWWAIRGSFELSLSGYRLARPRLGDPATCYSMMASSLVLEVRTSAPSSVTVTVSLTPTPAKPTWRAMARTWNVWPGLRVA